MCCSDLLWRLIKSRRGGPRGYKQKVTHLVKGIEEGHYVDQEPYICETGWQYAKDWGFTVVLDVYNPHYYKPESPIWVAESDTEEAQRPKPKLLESRPKTKARATSSRATAEEVEEIEEEEEVVTTSVRTFPKIVKVPSQKEKPSHILPDLVVLYEKDDQGNFVQTRDTRFFAGYRSYYSTEQNIQLQAKGKGFHESIRLAVFLDYHQVLDRSYSESAWSSGALPKDSVTFLRKVKESAERVFGNKDSVFVAVLSHIESSSKNETSLLQNINNSPVGSEDLVQIILITRQRVGALGKAKTIEAVTQGHRIPSVIVDDNHQVIQECSDQRIHTAHIKLRRKPAVEDAEVVKNFLLETAEPIERLFGRYRWALPKCNKDGRNGSSESGCSCYNAHIPKCRRYTNFRYQHIVGFSYGRYKADQFNPV